MKIIYPENAKLSWVLSERDKSVFIKACWIYHVNLAVTKMSFLKREAIESIEKDDFTFKDLQTATAMIGMSRKAKEIVVKLKKLYPTL